jgi:hypothetical protein
MYEKSKKLFFHDTNTLRNTNTFKESGQILEVLKYEEGKQISQLTGIFSFVIPFQRFFMTSNSYMLILFAFIFCIQR